MMVAFSAGVKLDKIKEILVFLRVFHMSVFTKG